MQYLKAVRSRIGSYHIKSGIFHHNRAEFKQASDFFRRALKEEGLEANERRTATAYLTQTYLGWAEDLLEQGDQAGALDKFEAALEISPRFADIQARRGVLLRNEGRPEEARAAFAHALEINPDFADARIHLGYLLLDTGRVEEAAQEFERAFLLNLKATEKPFFEGKTLILEGQVDRGRELIRKAFDRRPYEAEGHVKAGLHALRHERWLESIEEFGRAVELDKPYADLHNYLGIAYYETGRAGDAEKQFRKSFEINPDFLAPRLNLSYMLFEQGNVPAAETVVQEVLKREPDNRAALECLRDIERSRPAVRKGCSL